MICSKCGAEIRDDAKTCVKCGAKVGKSSDAEGQAAQPKPGSLEAPKESHYPGAKKDAFEDLEKAKPKVTTREMGLLGVVVVLFLVGLGLLLWHFTKSEEPPPKPAEKKVAPKPKPKLDTGAVQKLLEANKAETLACYQAALAKDAALVGTVKIQLKVNIDGSLVAPKLTANLEKAPEVGTCVLEKLKTWKFPKAQNGMFPLELPFQFSPEDVKEEPKGKKGKKK